MFLIFQNFKRTPLGSLSVFCCFFVLFCFSLFTTNFYYCFFGISDCWLHFFMSPTFLLFCQVLHFCLVVPQLLRIWQCYGFLTLRRFLPYTLSPHLSQYRECYVFDGAFFYSQAFFTLYSFRTFGATNQGFPESRQFFLEVFRALHWGLEHWPCPSACLNHTVFSKKY